MTPSYACFFHPRAGRQHKSLDELCPDCGRPFSWPLDQKPTTVGNNVIVESKSRGFYGATYVAESGGLRQKRIVKVVPVATYLAFEKRPWLEEVTGHMELANQYQSHFVRIFDAGTDIVTFGDGTSLECHWAQMDYIEGPSLEDFVREEGYNVQAAAQITIDLLEILRVLEDKKKRHNDLHANNIIVARLTVADRRAGAIDESVRAIAIDFGSLDNVAIEGRPTDKQRVGEILQDFANKLLNADPTNVDSRSYRLAAELTRLREFFASSSSLVRPPDYGELQSMVRNAMTVAADAEWSDDDKILTVSEGYNAQTLRPSTVARLLVDDQGWTSQIASGGAQIVLGMRGCGKTMLLRSIEFHARIALARIERRSRPIEKVQRDGFVGLYVSGARLLDARRNPKIDFRPILFAAYAREAARIIMHLRRLGEGVDSQAESYIADIVQTQLGGAELGLPVMPTAESLDQALQKLLFRLASGEAQHPLNAAAATAFPQLASALVRATGAWGQPRVLYLLDDVSTRYLDDELIRKVLGEVLFQSDICAFKVTTETQTWVSVLRSPGNVEALREDRDFKRFDLGERVSRRLADEGWQFVDSLLHHRLQASGRHQQLQGLHPHQILGRRKLEEIAQAVADTETTSADRKEVYAGIEALAAICVGDIGDTITLFERMLERAEQNAVSPRVQTDVYRQFCGERLWELSSKNVDLKDYALGFAEAAYELLKSSARKKASNKGSRLRQYTKLYLRDLDERGFQRVRLLIDAGVFVVEGGVPRSKTKDFDPMTHFVLVFRKLLGVSSFIALSDRDRFELSGKSLNEWLSDPSQSKSVLIRNQDMRHRSEIDAEASRDETAPANSLAALPSKHEPVQRNIFDIVNPVPPPRSLLEKEHAALPRLQVEEVPSLHGLEFELLVTGFGFEDRATASSERLVRETTSSAVLGVRYPEGFGNPGIASLFRDWKANVKAIARIEEIDLAGTSGPVLIDVTGLRTTYLWKAVRDALLARREVWIAYTGAQQYSPFDDEVGAVLEGEDDSLADSRHLNKLRDLVSGESREYELIPLLETRDDIMRPLALIAAASPKMMRLERLLSSRAFDRLELLASDGASPRAQLSRVAAKAAAVGFPNNVVSPVPPTNLTANVEKLESLYRPIFIDAGMDVALGLTGSKIQAVAMAALSAAVKVAEAWYVQPASYDTATFSGGSDTTVYYKIGLPCT